MSKWVRPSDKDQKEMLQAEKELANSEADNMPRQQRMRLNAKVTIRSQTNFFMGFSENISEGGVFISTLSPPNIGEKIEVNIPIGEKSMVVHGVVRWHRQQADGSLSGCGVEFSSLGFGAQQSIEELIRILRKEPLFVDL